MESLSAPKWKAKVSTLALEMATADQIWPLLLDFFNLHQWFPSLAMCRGVHGTNGEPGAIRYCTGFSLSASSIDSQPTKYDLGNKDKSDPVNWSKEKLVSVDHVKRSLSYEIVENIGFKSYVSTIGVVPRGDGCLIEWEIVVDPVEGWELDDLVSKYEMGLKGMAKNMEDHVLGIH
ncbi:lachrymatory-factor synthase [Punica granatum]|uniref:Uncharacterized protein n=2 Tax=Punica granatum TaxID=22663 RepID=A0A218XMW1_PUNGR|nr:lachrymatory-factor synthase [Punica granatum]OWM86595.1 hypothetical protein CDL15_Pgr015630 [Punica granatum]PKI67182.1 hypothetical protein CRG98_012431 [Punica granatum]